MIAPLLISLFAVTGVGGTTEEPRPNVILIMTDDQGCGDFGFAGHTVLRTPNLDRLAADGSRVEPFYVSPVCAPTRASLMTGRYCYRTRVTDTWIGRAMMDADEVTIAEMLKNVGYATGIFGKWHLGDCFPMRPQDQGFDEVLVHRGGGIGQPSDPIGGERKYTDPWLVHNGEVSEFKGYCTDVFFQHAIDWMRARHTAGQPFFCYLPTNAPHGPFHDVPADTLTHYQGKVGDREARIYAMIENIDQNIGRLRAALSEMGAVDNTLVLFMVDNGPNTRRYVRDLRGMKSEVHEGGIRSPFVACWPGRLEAGRVVARIGAHIDVLPTLAEVCAAPLPQDRRIDGRSLWPWLKGQAPAGSGDSIADDPRKLVIQLHRGDEPQPYHHFMLRQGWWKLVRPTGFGRQRAPAGSPFLLYDLQHDPGEKRDLAAENPDRVHAMMADYLSWYESVSQERPQPFDPPRILVGTTQEPVTLLTRQDRRVLRPQDGWGIQEVGEWWLTLTRPGIHHLVVHLPAAPVERRLQLDFGQLRIQASIPAGAERLELDTPSLPAGDVELQVRVWQGDQASSIHQLEIRRLG